MSRIHLNIVRLLFPVLLFCMCSCGRQPLCPDVQAARDLACRLSPELGRKVEFRIENADSSDYYTLRAEDGKLVIAGNNANSLAMGLGDYLRDCCKVTVTQYAADKVALPSVLPMPQQAITRRAVLKDRFFLNYCTYGYSMPWYGWEDWERLIDWMALNGVNMALANTGAESVWMDVWQEFGLSEEQIREYFTGPAFLAWHRMTNIDKWDGPLPMEWIEGQCELQKKIVERENSLGISPILSAFTGHVPEALKSVFPDADIKRLSCWVDFDEQHTSWYLNPADSLYGKIQKAFLSRQKELYGQNSHIYGVDLFNEMEPPLWDAEYLREASRLTYEAISDMDPDAVWLQMGWLFYYQPKWTPELIEAYVSPVPKGRLVMLDYYCDKTEVYRTTENFFGQDFIWSFLGNFGGRTIINGNVKDACAKIDRALETAPEECVGVGCTLEGLDVNPHIYEYVLSRAWEKQIEDDCWIDALADRHLGYADEHNRAAWQIMYNNVLKDRVVNGSLVSVRPNLSEQCKGNFSALNRRYDNRALYKAWGQLLDARQSDTPAYRFDCVNFGRQCLSNYFSELAVDVLEAYGERNLERIRADHEMMTGILADMDELVAADSYFLLGKWLSDARRWGDTKAGKDYYERDARLILSTWGPKGSFLTDYANREWNGLLSSYYAPRWEKFLTDIENAVADGREFDEEAFRQWSCDFEWAWVDKKQSFPDKPRGDACALSRKMYEKYGDCFRYANRAEKILSELNNPFSDYVLVACHRGDWRNYPENSIPAIESVIRMGADIAEIDVKMTKDSQLVVIHDWTATRTMNIHPERDPGYESPLVKDLTLAQLKALKLRRAQGITTDSLRIPTLEEALRVCKDRILVNLDGGIRYVDQVMSVAQKVGVVDQIILKGTLTMEEFDSAFSKYGQKPIYMPMCGGLDVRRLSLFTEKGKWNSALNPVAYEIYFKKDSTTEDYVKATSIIHKAGSRVWMNTLASMWSGEGNDDDAAYACCDPGDVYGPVIEHGINIIQTDRPELLLSYLRKVGLHD